jgi:hypothetical protein
MLVIKMSTGNIRSKNIHCDRNKLYRTFLTPQIVRILEFISVKNFFCFFQGNSHILAPLREGENLYHFRFE